MHLLPSLSSRYPSGPSPAPANHPSRQRSILPPCPATAHSLEGAPAAPRARAAANADDVRSRAATRAVTRGAAETVLVDRIFLAAGAADRGVRHGPRRPRWRPSGRASSPSLAKGTVVRCASCVLGCASTARARREISLSMEEAPAVVAARNRRRAERLRNHPRDDDRRVPPPSTRTSPSRAPTTLGRARRRPLERAPPSPPTPVRRVAPPPRRRGHRHARASRAFTVAASDAPIRA